MEEKKQTKSDRKLYLNEYRKLIVGKWEQEVKKVDIINDFNNRRGQGLTSPTTGTTTEETRLLMEYIDKANLFNITKQNQKRAKSLKLRKFFKSKRNQQVEVYSLCGTDSIYKEGKVSTVGRDFVMLTNLKERCWIPYSAIDSANIPYGIPTYSNTHQHFLYDNNLRQKLLLQFGETVAKRDLLKQQFFEESFQTNLDTWRETWVAIHLNEKTKKIGKIKCSAHKKITLTNFGKEENIDLTEIKYIETIRWITLFTHIFKQFSHQ